MKIRWMGMLVVSLGLFGGFASQAQDAGSASKESRATMKDSVKDQDDEAPEASISRAVVKKASKDALTVKLLQAGSKTSSLTLKPDPDEEGVQGAMEGLSKGEVVCITYREDGKKAFVQTVEVIAEKFGDEEQPCVE
jgi:hypothetical protein